MIALRMLRLCLHLVRGMCICAFIFPRVDVARRQLYIQQWSQQLLAVCGMRINIKLNDIQPAQHALIVANHVSWLDIFVINSLYPCRFVAKSDIRSWPLIGWLCEKTGTIFIARGSVRDVRRIFQGLVTSLHAGERVAFFPEGTTASQGILLPFHANLFEAAIDAHVPVQPYALRYVDPNGELHTSADFIDDMTFVESIIAIMRARHITAQLIALPAIDTTSAHRRELAEKTRQSIGEALGYL
jgi:1-acyl-sn-glycerol-3-phosphate acyltransferase